MAIQRSSYMRQLGSRDIPVKRAKRCALHLQDGLGRIVWPDDCSDASASGVSGYTAPYSEDDNLDRIRVSDIAYTTDVVTTRASIALPSSRSFQTGHLGAFTADLFSDGDVGVVYMTTDNVLRWARIDSTTWTITQDQSISTDGANILAVDLSISDGDVPVVVTYHQMTTGTARHPIYIHVRRTDTSVFQTTKFIDFLTGNSNVVARLYCDISVASIMGGSATVRPVVVAAVGGTQTVGDLGVKIYSANIDETTGAISGATLRQSYFSGDLPFESRSTVARTIMLFRSATGQATFGYLGIQTAGRRLAAADFAWNGTTWTETMSPQSTYHSHIDTGGASISYGSNTFVFFLSNNKTRVVHWPAQYNRTNKTITWHSFFTNDEAASGVLYPVSGVGRNAGATHNTRHPVFLPELENGYYQARVNNMKDNYSLSMSQVTPKNGTTVNTSTPALAIAPPMIRTYPQGKIKGVWRISSSSGFATYVEHVEPDSGYVILESGTVIQDTLPDALRHAQGTWYIKGATLDLYGNTHNFWNATANSFTITHPPTAVTVSPSEYSYVPVASGATTVDVTFEWTFADSSHTDTQTAYEIEVRDGSSGAALYNTGQVISTAQTATHTLPQAVINAPFVSWGLRVWDTDGVVGSYSNWADFWIKVAATVSITSPTNNGTVSTAVPSATYTITIPSGGRTVTSADIIFKNASGEIVHSGHQELDVTATGSTTYTASTSVLTHLSYYTVYVIITDQYGMTSTSSVITFQASFVLPANPSSPTASATLYNDETAGYIALAWTNTNRDADFSRYIIYRKDDMIDASNNVVQEGTYKEIYYTAGNTANFTYRDYIAPSGYKVNYKFVQEVNRFGSIVESSGTVVSVYPVSDGYWLIEHTSVDEALPEAFKLALVVSDDYSDEYEESEFVVIGRGRHIDRGEYLGFKGTLSAQIRDNGGTTARQKKLRIEELRSENRDLFLRNPFGDVFNVAVGNISVSRIAGVGLAEYCDIQIPYSQVYEQ